MESKNVRLKFKKSFASINKIQPQVPLLQKLSLRTWLCSKENKLEIDPCGMECSVLYCINGSILVVILLYSFTRCYHWAKVRGTVPDLSALFPITSCESTITSKSRKWLNKNKDFFAHNHNRAREAKKNKKTKTSS